MPLHSGWITGMQTLTFVGPASPKAPRCTTENPSPSSCSPWWPSSAAWMLHTSPWRKCSFCSGRPFWYICHPNEWIKTNCPSCFISVLHLRDRHCFFPAKVHAGRLPGAPGDEGARAPVPRPAAAAWGQHQGGTGHEGGLATGLRHGAHRAAATAEEGPSQPQGEPPSSISLAKKPNFFLNEFFSNQTWLLCNTF